MLSRRRFLTGSLAAAGAGLGLYSWQVEPHWVEVVRRPMPLPGLPAALDGATLLQLSDLHVGPRVDSAYLIGALRRAARLAPDFVAVTGDFVSYRTTREYRELARVLQALPRGRHGTYASLGNHDYGFGWRQLDVAAAITQVVEDAGAVVLRNAAVSVGGLQVAGLADFWSPEFPANSVPGLDVGGGAAPVLQALDPRRPALVLCHNPDALDEPLWSNVHGWVLAGHTHGGQCRPPFLPPPILPVRNRRYTAGAIDVAPGRTVYINRGLGHLIQVRFNVRPEITLFTLERTAA